MQVICLDLEGVLVPEIWIAFSKRTGIAELSRTTRDEPDYDKLMRFRIGLLRQRGLKLADIQEVIAGMGPMEGAKDFLDDLRSRYQVMILSDTFYEFAQPLMRQLGWPTLLCHKLEVDGEGFVTRHVLRMADQKRHAVNALRLLNFQVIAAGDSYNDTGMLMSAHAGFFIHPPESIVAQFPQFPVTRSYPELKAAIDSAAAKLLA
ncbi:MAG: bifunctional phosphoserine phosphatase/homoserine phosphotransferase ThrH [Piscinibacter sp.]|uniref:bifunctional phosphoserine phosphatase/homoserine phosphotransferase ThrH n=1 Tax=Piscinibacter sp. TaxID=1903157 RepID=UPI001B423D3A|nr:bifunctional phosphoserine phosphatase/homoserine phosphotransferase ThrH [Piscinibacter sp.]MBP5992303.1 bifunctional phosphoserine phosphatase/homoserine phosphotransferase ThrH [Piscinibacter sp.]MBP6029764.1 bifunctional phosphoserine phosphatase/homoserine phosphotransferase ThrH [Piscinibacter sp.]